jgi:hypothetical protein
MLLTAKAVETKTMKKDFHLAYELAYAVVSHCQWAFPAGCSNAEKRHERTERACS